MKKVRDMFKKENRFAQKILFPKILAILGLWCCGAAYAEETAGANLQHFFQLQDEHSFEVSVGQGSGEISSNLIDKNVQREVPINNLSLNFRYLFSMPIFSVIAVGFGSRISYNWHKDQSPLIVEGYSLDYPGFIASLMLRLSGNITLEAGLQSFLRRYQELGIDENAVVIQNDSEFSSADRISFSAFMTGVLGALEYRWSSFEAIRVEMVRNSSRYTPPKDVASTPLDMTFAQKEFHITFGLKYAMM
jgi:hypothetical protein